MRALFLRELRRQLPIALGVLLLGGLMALAATFLAENQFSLESGAAGAFVIVVLVAPLLLGIATVAPDVENGSAAFLARLPMARLPQLAVRWSVAAALAAATIAIDYASTLSVFGKVPLDAYEAGKVPVPLFAVPAFAGAIAASVASRRTLAALVAAPLLAVGPAVLMSGLASPFLHTVPNAGVLLVAFAIALLFVGAIAGFLRGDVHRKTFRPAFIVGGCVLGGSLLASGAVQGYDRALERWQWAHWPTVHATEGRKVLLTKLRVSGLGEWRETRTVVLDLADPKKDLDLHDLYGAATFSPRATKVLIGQWGDGTDKLDLVDVATGARTTLSVPHHDSRFVPPIVVSGPSHSAPWFAPNGVAWKGDEPVLVREDGALAPTGADLGVEPSSVVSGGGSRLLVAGGHAIWDLERRQLLPSRLETIPNDAEVLAARLSSDGTHIAALISRSGGHSVFLADATTGERAVVDLGDLPGKVEVQVAFGRGTAAIHDPASSRFFTVDLAMGVSSSTTLENGSILACAPKSVLDLRQPVLDPATGKPVGTWICAPDEDHDIFVDDDGRTIWLREAKTGRVTCLR